MFAPPVSRFDPLHSPQGDHNFSQGSLVGTFCHTSQNGCRHGATWTGLQFPFNQHGIGQIRDRSNGLFPYGRIWIGTSNLGQQTNRLFIAARSQNPDRVPATVNAERSVFQTSRHGREAVAAQAFDRGLCFDAIEVTGRIQLSQHLVERRWYLARFAGTMVD